MNLKLLYSSVFFLFNNQGYPLFHFKYNGYGLDINGKDGLSMKEIKRHFPETTFFGVDNNRRNVLKLQKDYPSFNFLYKDIENDDIHHLYKKFQVVQISEYNNIEKMLENTNKLLKEDGVCILRYKEKDFLKIKKLIVSNKNKSKQYFLGRNYDTMYHLPKNNTLLWFS